MSPESLDLRALKAIVDWINVTEDIREFSLKFDDVELYISRNQHASEGPRLIPAPAAVSAPVVATAAAAQQPTAAATEVPLAALAPDEVVIKAPMVGTFYAAPKPGQPDFVAVGDRVGAESVLCIVEIMKLMNNIEAGVDGTVVSILVGNEQAVQYGQPLMVIKRASPKGRGHA